MALTLEEAVQRRRLEEALSHLDTGATPLDIPTEEAPPQSMVPGLGTIGGAPTDADSQAKPAEEPDKKSTKKYEHWGNWDTVTDEQIIAPDEEPKKEVNPLVAVGQVWDWVQGKPVKDVIYPTDPRFWASQDQGAPEKKYDTQVAEEVVPYGEREKPAPPPSPYVTMDTGKGASPEAYPPVAQDQGAREGSGEQAPDALTQVERGELWREPWHPSKEPIPPPKQAYPEQIVTPDEASGKVSLVNPPVAAPEVKPVVPEVKSAAPVSRGEGFWGGDLSQGPPGSKVDGTVDRPYWPKGDKDIALLPPGANYIDPHDQSQKTVPGAVSEQVGASAAASAAPTEAKPAVKSSFDDWGVWLTPEGTPGGTGELTETTPVVTSTVNPDGTPLPPRIQAVGGKDPVAIVIHHTGDHHTAPQTKSALDDRGLGVELTVDRDNNVTQIGNAGAANIKTGWGPKGSGLNNSNIIGIEVAAYDDKDVTPGQVQAVKNYLAARGYGNIPVFGHGEVNPGHKEADEGMTIVNSIRGDRAGGKVAQEANVGDSFTVLQKLSDSGLNATHFGYQGDPNLDKESARGSGKYVENMIPGYDVALNAKARAIVGNPEPGQEFQFAGRTWRYGDKVPELYKDARFDIFDRGNTIFTGGQLGKTATKAAPGSEEESWGNFTPVSTSELSAANKAKSDQEQVVLDNLLKKYKDYHNLGSIYKDIDSNTDVSPELRVRFKAGIQQQMTEQMLEYDSDLKELSKTDPEKAKMLAWAKWHNPKGEIVDTNAGSLNPNQTSGINNDSIKDLWSKIQGAHIEFTNTLQDPISTERSTLDRFFKYALGKSDSSGFRITPPTEKEKKDLLDKLHDPNLSKAQQYDLIQKMLPQDTGIANIPYASEVQQALDHLGNADWMHKMGDRRSKDIHDAAVKLAGDPRMRDTFGGGVNDTIAGLTSLAEAGLIGGEEAPLGFIMQAADQAHTRIKAEHPEWTEEQINREAMKGALINSLGPIAGMKAFGALSGYLLKNIGNPVLRRLSNAMVTALGTGATGAGTSAITNLAEGKPVDVEEAKRQGLTFGALGLLHGAMHPPPGRGTTAVAPPVDTGHPQLEHVPVISPHFEVLPPDENPSGAPALKQGRVWEQVTSEHTQDDGYRGPISLDHADSNGNVAEVNARNEQTANRASQPGPAEQLLLGDRTRGPVESGRETTPVPGTSKELGTTPTPVGDRVTSAPETRPDIFGRPRRAATTEEGALAQVTAYHEAQKKIIAQMGWFHDPVLDPKVNIAEGRHIVVGGEAQDYIDRAKAFGLTKPADIVEFARRGMDEEITHALDFHSMRDEFDAAQKAGTIPATDHFSNWASKETANATREVFAAHDKAVASGDHNLANLIRNAVEKSHQLYHGQELSFNDIRRLTQDPNSRRAAASAFTLRMEMARQMDQAARRGEITEGNLPRWKKIAKSISDWIKRIVNHFKTTHAAALEGHLGPLLKKHLQGLIDKRRSMEAIAHGEKPPADTKTAFKDDLSAEMARPRSAARPPTRWEKQKTAFSAIFKGGESFGLDHPTTHAIARALRRIPSHRQNIIQFAGIPELQRALGAIRLGEHGRIGKEFADWFQARDRKQPLPPLSPKAQRLVDATVHTLDRLGNLAQRMGIKVTDGKGGVHPFTMIKDYFPRIISKDTENIFEQWNGTRAADFNRLYLDAMHKGVVKSQDEFFQKFERATMPEVTSNAFFANAEHSRQMHLPLEMHDWSPTALMRYVSRMTDRLAEIKGVGQKLNPSTHDLFDITEQKIDDDRTLSRSEKQMMAARINQIRQAIYRKEFVDTLAGPVGKTRGFITTTALGNWFTSAGNSIGGAVSNIGFGGPVSAAKAYGKVLFTSILKKASSIKEAQERGLMGHSLHDMSDDFEKVSSAGWLTKGRQGYNRFMMKWGGQNATEAVNRTVGMEQAKYLLSKYQEWGAPGAQTGFFGARARHMEEFFKRRGFSDIELQRLYHEGGDPNKPLGQEFIRQYVMDTHGNYSPGQTASHLFDSPWGKVLLMFQKFSANQWRMNTREYVLPMTRATGNLLKNTPEAYGDFGYQFLRNFGHFGFLIPAGGMLISGAINAMRGRKDVTPSIAQIGKEAAKGDYGQAFHDYIVKVWQAYQLAGMTGPIGNYVGLGMTAFGFTHDKLKNPLTPPMYSILIQPLVEYLQGIVQEGGNFSDPTLLSRLAQNISGIRVARDIIGMVESKLGVDDPIIHEGRTNALKNQAIFLSSRLRMYEDAHPELKKQNPPPMVRNDFSPYRDDIMNGLRYGDPALAVHAITTYLAKFSPAEAKGRLQKIQDSVNSSTPIKPGGQYSLEHQLEFLRWAKETQSPADARAIFNIAQTYARAAVATHYLDSPTAQAIAKLNFDKLTPPPKAATAAQNAQAARAGAQLLLEMQKRENALKSGRR